MYSSIKIRFYCATDVGSVRDNNEDNYCVGLINKDGIEFHKINSEFILQPQDFEINLNSDLILALGDGMGGANAGEVASQIAMDYVEESIKKSGRIPEADNTRAVFFRDILLDAHSKILKESRRDTSKSGMGTTAVIAGFSRQGLTICWSGDSRMYSLSPQLLEIRDSRLQLPYLSMITTDHSLVWEYVESGEMTAEEARIHQMSHVITQSLGSVSERPQPDIRFKSLVKGEKLLICSDGLNSMLREDEIEEILIQKTETVSTVQNLIQKANDKGGHDNITLIIAEILEIVEETEKTSHSLPFTATTANQIIGKKARTKSNVNLLAILTLLITIFGLMFFLYKEFRNSVAWFSISAPNIQQDSTFDKSVAPVLKNERKNFENKNKEHFDSSINREIEELGQEVKRYSDQKKQLELEKSKIAESDAKRKQEEREVVEKNKIQKTEPTIPKDTSKVDTITIINK